MRTRVFEATTGPHGNWGKFMAGTFDSERKAQSVIGGSAALPVLTQRGWTDDHFLLLDLETGEGALFAWPGLAENDMEKHRIWACPLFTPALQWLYENWDGKNVALIPDVIQLTFEQAPFALSAPRRPHHPRVARAGCDRRRRPAQSATGNP